MYVERTHPTQLNVHRSYKSGQLLLETVKMHGLNEFNLKKAWSEEEKSNVSSTTSNLLPLVDTRAIRFIMKRTKRFDYSIRLNDFEEVERNHFADREMVREIDREMDREMDGEMDTEMDRIEDEKMENISSSMYHLFYARMTQKNSPENQKETPEIQKESAGNQKITPATKSESDFAFLKPKVYHCYYCHKVFFHPTTYRRHMIHQLKKLRWCSVCKRGFVSKMWFKNHKLFCQNC